MRAGRLDVFGGRLDTRRPVVDAYTLHPAHGMRGERTLVLGILGLGVGVAWLFGKAATS